MALPPRDRAVLAATLAAAVVVPGVAWHHLATRVRRGLAPALSDVTAQPVAIGRVEAGLTGSVRLTDVEIGHLFRADAIEASVSLDNLLAGQLGADEIQIEGPKLAVNVDGAGDSDLARVIRRVAGRRGPGAGGGGATSSEARRRLRRVVVTDGALIVDVVGRGRLIAEDVELAPEPGGVRVATGAVTATGQLGPFTAEARFARAAADVSLPDASIPRVLAIGGAIDVAAGGAPLHLERAVLGRGLYGPGAITVAAAAMDGGVPRPIVLAARADRDGGAAVRIDAANLPLAVLQPLAPRAVQLDGARATGGVTLARAAAAPGAAAAAATHVELDLAVDGALIDSRAVAPSPVPVAGRVRVAAALAGGAVDIEALRLDAGALALTAHGSVRRGAPGASTPAPAGLVAGALDAELARAPCLAQLESIPATLRGPAQGLVLAGDAAAHARLRWDLDQPPGDAVELDVQVDTDGCQVVAEAPAADPRALRGAAEHAFPDGSHAVVGPGVGDWVALADLPGHVDGAFRAAEDARFFDHRGFDLTQIARSLEVDLREGRFARGGSTISQQLVKNEWLGQRRTLDRKLEEAILTWRLEADLPKRTILERYLNVIELGPHVFGVGAAARWWFGKPAAALEVREAAFLAALTAEPTSMSRRVIEARGLDRESADRVDTVLRAMRRAGVIDADELDRAKDERLAFRKEALAP